MEKFIQSCLEELWSQQETKNLIGELSSRITDHRGRVHQLLPSEPLRHPEVVPLVLVGMAADRPLESNFFPGLLEGLLGSLGIAAPGEDNPPTSSWEGAVHAWSSAVCEAISWIEQKEVEAPRAVGLPQCLDLHYEEDFLEKQRHQIPPIFSDLLFIPNMAKAVFKVVKPPVVLKALPSASSRKVPSAPNQPEDGGPELEVSKPKESAPSTSQPCQQVQEQTSEASNTDSDKADEPTPEEEQPPHSLKVKLPLKLLKRGSKAMASSSKDGEHPPKYGRNRKPTRLRPQPRPDLLRQPSGKLGSSCTKRIFLKSRKSVPGSSVSTKERRFWTPHPLSILRWVVDETHPPTVIGAHWIDHLDNKGRIAKCKPHDFKFEDEWLPLYTRAGVTKQVSGLSSLLNTQGDSPLIAVIPPDMLFQYEREYVIHQLHEADCLARVSVYYGENQRKQIAFCPYCGVMNENSVTTYSHVRKHLGITFLCGGCYGKLYKAPRHLSHHMKSCRPCLMNRPEGSRRSVRQK